MENNTKIYILAVVVGGTIGDFIPSLFHAGIFSLWSVLSSFIVAALFLWLAYKLSS